MTLVLWILGFMLSMIAGFCNIIASGWSVWPPVVLNGLTYFFGLLMNWNFILNTRALLTGIKYLVGFLIIYFGIKLALKLFNWIRGSGPLDV
jgi:hypothetical protein